MIDTLIDITLLAFLAITGIAIMRIRSLFAAVMLFGIFSLFSAGLFVVMDAADVAFTEAAIGAGISTVLMLGTLALVKNHNEAPPAHRAWIPLTVVSITGAALVYGTLELPIFGAPDSPSQQHVAPRYIEQGQAETGVPNLVTAVLASYRGYDTLGELTVIFTAGIGVLLLLGRRREGRRHRRGRDMIDRLILKVVAKFLIPVIVLFALYVQFHGDYSPGGGFQAGVIFSVAFILYALVFGLDTAELVVPPRVLRMLASLGVLIYAGTGFATLLLGGHFLDYSVLAEQPVEGQRLGILVIELGIGLTVSSVMLLIFFAFAGRERP